MWDNLGRTVAEYPHLSDINVYAPNGRVDVIGAENVDLLRDNAKPGIFISAHLGNWEIASLGATQRGLPIDRIYRQANNPWFERLIRHGRRTIKGALIPKGAQGARKLLRSLKNGNHIGMLVDQKMNDGIAVPFFERDAMTAPAIAQMALRFDCPIIAARVERLPGVRFRLTILGPLEFTPSGDHRTDIAAMMLLVNKQLESWIRETPEQWLWLHNRWPD
jgi:KDO2-lipid IV(A) lauroyltransferase